MKARGLMKTNGTALGIIETVGFVPAVEAGDAAVKTADVRLIGSQAVGGGLVSILMTGDVSAVKASVDAGRAAAARLGTVCSVTVIARVAEGLEGILIDEAKRPGCFPGRKAPAADTPEIVIEPGVDPEPDAAPMEATETPDRAMDDGEGDGEAVHVEMADLKKFKVTRLRRLARQIPGFSIERGEIKFAKKKDLLEAFAQYMKTLNR